MMHKSMHACALSVLLLSGCASTATMDNDSNKAAIAAQANTLLGIEYLRKDEYELSKKKLQKAIELKPDYAMAHEAIAVLYERVGEDELAEKHYLRGLKLNPDNADGHSNYGQFLCHTGRQKQAEEQFLIAVNNPFYKSPEVPLLNAGMCMVGIPDAVKAEQYFRMALDKNPVFGPALLQMAKLAFQSQNYLSARAYLQRFSAAEKHTPESLWLGVRTEYALKDHQAWGNYALQLRNLHPDSEQAVQLQEWENERRTGN
jgi:type IV pilus assembly protein PilF